MHSFMHRIIESINHPRRSRRPRVVVDRDPRVCDDGARRLKIRHIGRRRSHRPLRARARLDDAVARACDERARLRVHSTFESIDRSIVRRRPQSTTPRWTRRRCARRRDANVTAVERSSAMGVDRRDGVDRRVDHRAVARLCSPGDDERTNERTNESTTTIARTNATMD